MRLTYGRMVRRVSLINRKGSTTCVVFLNKSLSSLPTVHYRACPVCGRREQKTWHYHQWYSTPLPAVLVQKSTSTSSLVNDDPNYCEAGLPLFSIMSTLSSYQSGALCGAVGSARLAHTRTCHTRLSVANLQYPRRAIIRSFVKQSNSRHPGRFGVIATTLRCSDREAVV